MAELPATATGKLLKARLRELLSTRWSVGLAGAFGGRVDEPADHRLQRLVGARAVVEGGGVDLQLAVGARAFADDAAGVLDLGEAAEAAGVIGEVVDQAVDEVGDRDGGAAREIAERRRDAGALGAPLVLGDQRALEARRAAGGRAAAASQAISAW